MRFLVIRSLPSTLKNIQNIYIIESDSAIEACNKVAKQEDTNIFNFTAFKLDALKDGWCWKL